jgi:hypothetical protein
MNQINKTNQINQITRQTGLVSDVRTIKVLACKKAFRSLLGREYTDGK